LTLSMACPLFCWPFRLFVHFSFDPFDCLSSFLLTLSVVCPLERVKRKEDKQSKGLKEKRTNNRKGQKKRGQTTERVKRKEDKQSKGSFNPFDCLSSFLLTLSVVCPLFFWPFRLFVLFSFNPFGCLSSFLLTLSVVWWTNNRKGQNKREQTIQMVKRKEDKQLKGSTEKRTNHRKGQKKRGLVCPLFFWPFRLFVLFSFNPFDCLSSFLLTLSIVCPLLKG
jgi:Flp pilus assembly protein TadB